MQVDGDDNNYDDDGGGEDEGDDDHYGIRKEDLGGLLLCDNKYVLKITDDDIHYSFAENCEL